MTGDNVRPTRPGPGTRFGAELRRLRLAAGLPQAELARRVNYSKSLLSRIESGHTRPNDMLARACDIELRTGGLLARLVDPSRRRRPPWPVPTPVDLPEPAGVFIGRDEELAAITAAARAGASGGSSRIVALWGLPGVGKTELLVQAATRLLDDFPDGCLFLDLRGASDAARATKGERGAGGAIDAHDAQDRLLRRLGIAAESIPEDPDERAALYRRTLRGRRLLLVLDNPATAADVVALTVPGGRSIILLTTRHRLDALDEAHQLPLAPLGAGAAAGLFRAIAGDGLDERHAAAHQAVESIVAACGFLPLALRIVAARFRASELSIVDFRAAVGPAAGLTSFDDGERSVIRTFLTAFAALPPDQGHLLALLSLHPGPSFDARIAAVLTGDGASDSVAAARWTLEQLDAACMIRPVSPMAYVFHDLISQVAELHAAATLPGETIAASTQRLLLAYLTWAQQADALVTPDRYRPDALQPDQGWPSRFDTVAAARAWFTLEHDNLVDVCEFAARRGHHSIGWRLAYALRDHFFRTRALSAWIRTHEAGLVCARAVDDPWAVAVTQNNLGLAYAHAGRFDAASGCYAEALHLFQTLDDSFGEANTIGHQAWLAHAMGDPARAVRLAAAALAIYRRNGAQRHVGITLRTLGLAEIARGRPRPARRHLSEALDIFVTSGLALDESMALNGLGEVAYAEARTSDSLKYHLWGWRRARACASATEQARGLRGLAAVAGLLGRPASARRLLRHAAALTDQPQTT